MKSRVALVVLCVSLFAFAAQAQQLTPNEIFQSEGMLAEAELDVAAMEARELQLFAEALAQCGSGQFGDSPTPTYLCAVARDRHRIEFSRGRPIDQLMGSIRLQEELARIGEGSQAEIILRLGDIRRAFTTAANRRFLFLREQNEPEN